jgi:hypothetical protein
MPVPDERWEPDMTDTSRRTLLRAGVLGIVAGPAVTAVPAPGAAANARRYRRSRFTALRGSSFRLVAADGRWRVRLTAVGNLPNAARGDEDRFTVSFRCASGGPPQGTYSLERSGFTPTLLFVVPSDAARRNYRAVINRP